MNLEKMVMGTKKNSGLKPFQVTEKGRYYLDKNCNFIVHHLRNGYLLELREYKERNVYELNIYFIKNEKLMKRHIKEIKNTYLNENKAKAAEAFCEYRDSKNLKEKVKKMI